MPPPLSRRRRPLAPVLVLLVGLLAAWPAAAQSRLHFDRLDAADGLSQISARALLQDRKGFIWIATADGLNRYDGHDFVVYQHDPQDPETFVETTLLGLTEDRRGNLWVTSAMGAIHRFDPATGKAKRFLPGEELPAALHPGVFYEDPDGKVWLSPFGAGLVLLHADEADRVVHLEADPASADGTGDGLPNAFVTAITETRDGTVWIGTSGGLVRRLPPASDGRPRFRTYLHEAPAVDNANRQGRDVVTEIFEDRRGRLWVGTNGGGAFLFDRERELFEPAPRPPAEETLGRTADFIRNSIRHQAIVEDPAGNVWAIAAAGLLRWDPAGGVRHYYNATQDAHVLAHNFVQALLADSAGRIWAGGAAGGGVSLLQPTQDDPVFQVVTKDAADPYSLAGNLIADFLEDDAGNVWIGTQTTGISRYSPQKHQFHHLRRPSSAPPETDDRLVFSILVDRRGDLWLGTSEDGVFRFDPERREVVERYSLLPGEARDIGGNYVRALYEDRQGRIWAGALGAGLAVIDPDAGRVRQRFPSVPNDPTTLSHPTVNDVLEDADGILWVAAGGGGGGWNRLDPETGQVRRFVHDPEDPASLPSGTVWVTRQTVDGTLWVGTDSGLAHFNGATEDFTIYRHDEADAGSIRRGWITSIWEDTSPVSPPLSSPQGDMGDGVLYVGTYGGGLNRLDRSTGRFDYFSKRDGLMNDVVYALLPDDDGGLWMSTNQGLARFDLKTETFASYDVDDGLQANEFNNGAAFRTPAGELLFGGAEGVTAFFPKDVVASDFNPPVLLTSFRIFDREVSFDVPVDEVRNITLSHKENFFAFEFAALDYTKAGGNLYAYKLEGFDENWIESGRRRYASYTNLDGGTYTFRVRGTNSDGVFSDHEASVEVVIVPPPWKRTWAYALYVLTAVGLALGYQRFQTSRHRKEVLRQRRQAELSQARAIQLSMLPDRAPAADGWEIAVAMRTATEVGGDYYDFFPQEDGALYVVVGDATGHGMSAGMMVSMTKAALIAMTTAPPDDSLHDLNRVFRRIHVRRLKMALMAVLLRPDGEVRMASAAMPPLFHYRAADGTVREVLVSGLPLGGLPELDFHQEVFSTEPGDVLVMLSDGLPERLDATENQLGYEVVGETLKAKHGEGPEALIASLLASGDAWAATSELGDDVTVVVARRRVCRHAVD